MDKEESCDEMSAIMPELVVRRPVYQQDDLNRLSQYSDPKRSFGKIVSNTMKGIEPKSCLKSTIPITKWLSEYDWKHDILGDLIAGITVAVMHIPQGMAYAILGNVPPIIGIYMAFFPVLIYFIFGTSRHNSMGTFAVICMMTGKIVLSHSSIPGMLGANITSTTDFEDHAGHIASSEKFSPIQVATAVTFMVALMQVAMYFLRLGVISCLLSETLVSGFTTAAAIHVFTSQIKDLFGLKLEKRKGVFKVILTYYDIVKSIDNINTMAMVISAVTIIIIVFNNEILKPRVAKLCSIPIPIEMIVVILGTTVSVYADLQNTYDIIAVGSIPVGLPEPRLPPMELLPEIVLDSFVITMVSYTISMSMALIFAQKLNYEVDSNQELLAQGLGNLVGSFFSCMPFCASLSRSLIQQSVGGRTQLASLISCGLLLFVLLWIGPFFEPLPRCVLASIIVVALKGMLMQTRDFFRFLRLSRIDATIWLTTFVTVTVLDIEYGLLVGALLCLANLLTLSMRPYTCGLALVPGTELYLDTKRFKGTVEIQGLKIFHYCGGLNFASRQSFRKDVYRMTGIVPQKELVQREKLDAANKFCSEKDGMDRGYGNAAFEGDTDEIATSDISSHSSNDQEEKILKVLVLDFSSLVHIDPAGVATLRDIVDDYKKIDACVYISGCSGPVYETIRKCNAVEHKQGYFTMFPTVNDAVNYARYKKLIPSMPIWTATQSAPQENSISRLSPMDNIVDAISSTVSAISERREANSQSDPEKRKASAEYGTFTELHRRN